MFLYYTASLLTPRSNPPEACPYLSHHSRSPPSLENTDSKLLFSVLYAAVSSAHSGIHCQTVDRIPSALLSWIFSSVFLKTAFNWL